LKKVKKNHSDPSGKSFNRHFHRKKNKPEKGGKKRQVVGNRSQEAEHGKNPDL